MSKIGKLERRVATLEKALAFAGVWFAIAIFLVAHFR